MQFAGTDHHCDRHAEFEDCELTAPGHMVERRGVCQKCGRVIVGRYNLHEIQDAETNESVQC